MRLATVLTPLSDENLQLAAQCGVEDVVTRYPGSDLDHLLKIKRRIESFDMKLAVIEGYLPIEQIKIGRDDGTDLEAIKMLVRYMGQAEIPILCYNFMAGTDWVRTRVDIAERGGAKVTGFQLSEVQQALMLSHDASGPMPYNSTVGITEAELWKNLERFLAELVPVAEKAGVMLAMPLPELLGNARIMNSVENFERLAHLVPSPNNGICLCQGTFRAMGVDIPETIRRLGSFIRYVHFRDVRGSRESFVETFHDNGPTDMVAAVRAYREAGFAGPIRPDHVPQLVGEDDGEPGYTMLGRLFAYGYIRALLQMR
jgi:mannonate dehydratase